MRRGASERGQKGEGSMKRGAGERGQNGMPVRGVRMGCR